MSLIFLIPGTAALAYLVGMHVVFVITGSGEMLVSRPFLSLALTTFVTGIIILMTGFVCDFMLFHHARANSATLVDFILLDLEEGTAGSEQDFEVDA